MSAPRLPFFSLQPEAYKALVALNAAVEKSSLGKKLIDLIYLRVSQINSCSYCVDMHFRDLLTLGEDPRKLNSLVTWREAPFFDERERAALELAEQATRINQGCHIDDAQFDALGRHFTDQEIVALTFTIASINAWNRIGHTMRPPIPE